VVRFFFDFSFAPSVSFWYGSAIPLVKSLPQFFHACGDCVRSGILILFLRESFLESSVSFLVYFPVYRSRHFPPPLFSIFSASQQGTVQAISGLSIASIKTRRIPRFHPPPLFPSFVSQDVIGVHDTPPCLMRTIHYPFYYPSFPPAFLER